MTRLHFDLELKRLHTELEGMCDLVQRLIREAITALVNQDVALAKGVYAEGGRVNDFEHKIERLCLNLIARQQPLATDLRRISAALKIITDMERIGDQAEDICMLTIKMARYDEHTPPPADLTEMAGKVAHMVDGAIDAYVRLDSAAADAVCAADDEIDAMFAEIITALGESLRKNSGAAVFRAVNYVLVAKYLERIADHATNIAEWVAFIVTGTHKEGSANRL
ncbi:MAG: phosphate signaling complex protein PhoU [Clostridiales bacterium]|jgi:phosphate transport system protein|nr:phosphate signaling complex protein PhoU [Clostridiales bacterium]